MRFGSRDPHQMAKFCGGGGGDTFLVSLAAKLRIVTEPSHLVSNEPFCMQMFNWSQRLLRVKP